MDINELNGKAIQSYKYNYTLSLSFSGNYTLVIESDVAVRTAGQDFRLSPDTDPGAGHEALSALTGLTVVMVRTDPQSSLSLTFADDSHLSVDPDPAFESWTLSGPAGERIVCMPGGELAVWSSGDG